MTGSFKRGMYVNVEGMSINMVNSLIQHALANSVLSAGNIAALCVDPTDTILVVTEDDTLWLFANKDPNCTLEVTEKQWMQMRGFDNGVSVQGGYKMKLTTVAETVEAEETKYKNTLGTLGFTFKEDKWGDFEILGECTWEGDVVELQKLVGKPIVVYSDELKILDDYLY